MHGALFPLQCITSLALVHLHGKHLAHIRKGLARCSLAVVVFIVFFLFAQLKWTDPDEEALTAFMVTQKGFK